MKKINFLFKGFSLFVFSILALVLLPSMTFASRGFSLPVNYDVGSGPRSVTTGDFDKDGNLDLVVANYSSNNVSILIGNGDGTFDEAVNYDAGTSPQSVITGDFDEDGSLDLATANNDSNNVSILIGNGDGTFDEAVNYEAGSSPSSVTTGDFDGDGSLDLAVTNYNSNNVSILIGNGDGTFDEAVNYEAGRYPNSITTGFFNSDSYIDLAVAETNISSNTVSNFLGNGDGTFGTKVDYGRGISSTSITTGDFDEDGNLDLVTLDLVTTDANSSNISILLGNGDGTFDEAVNYDVGNWSSSVTTGDFDGDGSLDLATANAGSQNISILLNNEFDDTFPFAGGTGTEEDPFQIATCEQLQSMNNYYGFDGYKYLTGNYHFVLSDNINCADTSTWNDGLGFMPIGYTYDNNTSTEYGTPFVGYFDGDGHTVSNLYINRPDFWNVGLFGYIGSLNGKSATITDIGLNDIDIIGGSYVGGLVGFSNLSHIENSYTTGNVSGTSKTSNVGGLVGYTSQGYRTVLNSYADVDVSGTSNVGGLVGYNDTDTIELSYATGKVTGTMYIGGLVGYNSNGQIYTSYATGDVLGISRLGGLVGMNNQGHIENTYATGTVSGNGRIGGLVGQTQAEVLNTIANSYANGDVAGNQYVGGLIGENDADSVYNSYSTGTVVGRNYTGGLIGYLNSNSSSYKNFIHNSGWYKGSQDLPGIGYDTSSSSSVDVDYTLENNSVLYSNEHSIYNTKGPWDFEETWTEVQNDYPRLINNYEERGGGGEDSEDLHLQINRLSVSNDRDEANNDSITFGGSYNLSEDGRYVVFISNADNLVSGDDNGYPDVFIYDTKERNIDRIIPKYNYDVIENYTVNYTSISNDGRYVAFAGDYGNGYYIELYDKQTKKTKIIGSDGMMTDEFKPTPFNFMPYPSISGDGKMLLVTSPLINGPQVPYYINTQTGEVQSIDIPVIFRGSISRSGENATFGVIFDLMSNIDTNELMDIYALDGLKNTDLNDPESYSSIDLVSLKPDGEQFTEDDDISYIFAPFISEDGRYVTFSTYTMTSPLVGYSTVYLRDREEETTIKLYQSDVGVFNFFVSSMSNDGRFIVFASSALSLATPAGESPVFIYDTKTSKLTTLITESNNNSATISSDGQYIAFASTSNDLVANDNNNASDIFLVKNPYFRGSSHSGGSGGSGSAPVSTTSQTQTEEQNQTSVSDSSCLPGYLFSPTTGKPCPSNSQGQTTSGQTSNQHRTLKMGMVGDDVKALQVYLNTHGYPLSTTGAGSLGNETTKFGPLTKKAVIKFQLANRLLGDGIVGPKTWAVIDSIK